MSAIRNLLAVLVLGLVPFPASAQNLLPNPGFEAGTDQPTGWRLTEGPGDWVKVGSRAATNHVLQARGNGDDESYWRTPELRLKPGGVYALHFRARRLPGADGGTAIAGTSRVNRDFPLDTTWREYRFVFSVPNNGGHDYVRLGQWHVKGAVQFDDAGLLPVLVGQSQNRGGIELGEGESIVHGIYHFRPQLNWAGANDQRPLWRNEAGFNSDRWLFVPGAEFIYRFALPGCEQTNGQVRLNLNYYVAGAVAVSASTDAAHWLPVATFDGQHRAGSAKLPASLFPANVVYVRLAAAGHNVNLQVDTCNYQAGLNPPPPDATGATKFVAMEKTDPRLEPTLRVRRVSPMEDQTNPMLQLANRTNRPLTLSVHSWSDPAPPRPARAVKEVMLGVGESFALNLRAAARGIGERIIHVRVTDPNGQVLFAGRSEVRRSFLDDTSYGHWLGTFPGGHFWWCESGWKVGRFADLRGPKRGEAKRPVSVSLAGGEYEPAQVVLRPQQPCTLRSVAWSKFTGPDGETSAIKGTIDEVAYVYVTHPTDATCERGWYPDPLPPLQVPLKLDADENHPLWLTFYAPRGTPAGTYTGNLTLKLTESRRVTTVLVPLAINVYGFDLPVQTHLRSALGLGTSEINRYQKLTRRADQIAVFKKYLADFAAHRISPYSFYDYAPISVRFVGQGTNKHAVVDFSRFDVWAKRWLGKGGFNTFRLPLRGMGGGTFYSRHEGELAGFKAGTPEYARLLHDYLGQIQRHLQEKGWLSKAFTYWFDEPAKKDYPFVVAGMERLKAAAPKIKRMLTEEPEPELIGHVDIWCGLTPHWTRAEVRARRAAGDEVWWYICTGPKAPYITEFIDHPGTELRLWPWQSWEYGVNGILIWATTYWTSSVAYPHSLQNPWKDPMSWVNGYGTPVGTRRPWGNGDGRFLYPPRRDPNTATTPSLSGPINSIRWEDLRDGMEDYEYFWLLNQAVKRAAADPGTTHLVQAARRLLVVPANISKDLTHFTTDPRLILARRDQIARMIERLDWPVFFDAEKGPSRLTIARTPKTLDAYTLAIPTWNRAFSPRHPKIKSCKTTVLGSIGGMRVLKAHLALTDPYYTDLQMVLQEVRPGHFLPVYVQVYNRKVRVPIATQVTREPHRLIVAAGMSVFGTGHSQERYRIRLSAKGRPTIVGVGR